jgi:ABC-type branched-subunit amino acid transport system substrate-binding protein
MLKRVGIEVVDSQFVNNFTNSTFDAEVQKTLAARPDTIGILFGPGLSAIVKGLRAQGWKGRIFTVQGPASFVTSAGSGANGIVQPMTFSPIEKSAVVQAFVKAWKTKYGTDTPVDYGAAEAYDATLMLALGIKEARTADKAGVRAGVAAVARRGFNGVQGRITFKGQQGRVSDVVLVEYGGNGKTARIVK